MTPLLELLANTSAGLAFIIFLTIVAGRRENSALCIAGARYYLKLALWFWPAGLAVPMISYFSQVAHYGNPLPQMLAPLLQPAGFPWTTSFLAWVLAGICLSYAAIALASFSSPKTDHYTMRAAARPILATGMAFVCFYASLCLINWPFAGLPPDLRMDYAVLVITRHALHKYILCLCPAGAFALVLTLFLSARIPEEAAAIAIRWPAIWAAAGAIPTLLQTWGTLLGLGIGGRLQGSLSQGFWQPASAMLMLTLAVFVWIMVIWKPLNWRKWGMAGCGLLLLKTVFPALAAILH